MFEEIRSRKCLCAFLSNIDYRSTSLFNEQETQLSLTNRATRRFRGQSRSPNMLPFHLIGVVSY